MTAADSGGTTPRKVPTQRLSEFITADIRAQMQDRTLRTGDRLPAERQLSEQYQTSRVAVREGLRSLEESGLLEIRKGRSGGAYVTGTPSPVLTRTLRDMVTLGGASADDMFEARAWVMDATVRLACRNRSATDIEALAHELELVRRKPTPDDDMEQRTHQALNFNLVIARAGGNAVLTTFVEALVAAMEDMLRPIRPPSYAPIVKYYSRIVEGIESRDENLAASSMAAYLRDIKRDLVTDDTPANSERGSGPTDPHV